MEVAAVEAVLAGLKAKSFSSLAEVLLSPEDAAIVKRVPYVDGFGALDDCVADMNSRPKSDMGKVAGMFLDAILGTLKAGKPDLLGVARAMANRRNGGSAAMLL